MLEVKLEDQQFLSPKFFNLQPSLPKDGLMLAAQVFSNTAGILSGPVALSTSRVLSTQQTSPSANSRSEMVIRLIESSSAGRGL
jgi:hypothetical protein